MLHNLGEWQTLVSKSISSRKPREQPSHHQPDQNLRQCPEFLLPFRGPYFGNCRQPLSGRSSRQLSFSPSHCPASGSLLEPTCRPNATICHVASRSRWSHKCTSKYVHKVAKRVSLPSFGLMLF